MSLGQNSTGRDLKNRYLPVAILFLGGVLMLALQLYRLQVVRHEEFEAKSMANRFRLIRITADRGMIKDRRGEMLVDNRPSFDAYITPAFCQKCRDEVLPRLAQWLRWDPLQLEKVETDVREAMRGAEYQPLPVRVDLTREEFDLLNAHKMELPGVDVVSIPHRSYRTGTVLAHALGYTNEIGKLELARKITAGKDYVLGDYIGRSGLEKRFEDELRGKDGLRTEVVNARGEPIPELNDKLGGGDQTQPVPGNNLVLTIDYRLQAEAERAFPGTAGAVIAMETKTGFIRALVSRPGYDPNLMTGRITPQEMLTISKDPLQPLINRVAQQHYSPGSVFKVVTALAALRSGLFSPSYTITCGGGYRLGARTWRCWNDRGHGTRMAVSALQSSCDVYYYKVADTLGLDPIAAVGRELGLGAPTGIGVLKEVPGIMPDSKYHDRVTPGGYTKGMALNSAIGQGDDTVTPLQIAMVYSTIANGGAVYQPQLVQKLEAADGTTIEAFQPNLLRKIPIAEDHHRLIISALSAVVNEPGGTAYSKRLKDIKVAGKTGTAQVARIGAVRIKKEQMDYFQRDHAWFASFAPVEDPELTVVVLNEHGGHGGSDAAPTAMAVIQKYFDLKKEDAAAAAPKPLPGQAPVRPPSELTPDKPAAGDVLGFAPLAHDHDEEHEHTLEDVVENR
jgi:penicillin-binding protein 2